MLVQQIKYVGTWVSFPFCRNRLFTIVLKTSHFWTLSSSSHNHSVFFLNTSHATQYFRPFPRFSLHTDFATKDLYVGYSLFNSRISAMRPTHMTLRVLLVQIIKQLVED